MPQIFPIAGGKGGVGKSFISANLGTLMAKYGYRVALIDLDLGASNLHTLLGVKKPKCGIHTFLEKPGTSLGHVAVPTRFSNLTFIGSVDCSIEIANLYHAQKIKLINAVKKLPFDYILLDLGAGTNFNTLDFFLTSDQGIVVCTPEPTSIENSFRFIKAAYLRKLKQIIKCNAFYKMVKDVVFDSGGQEFRSMDIIDLVIKYDPGRELFLRESISRFRFKFILNQLRRNGDPTLGEKIVTVCNRHFYSKFDLLGTVDFDERVSDTISKKTLFAQQHPDARVSAALRGIADQLISKRITNYQKSEDQYGFILHHHVMEKQKDVEIAVMMVAEAKRKFAALSCCSFDKGFYSPTNKQGLQEILDDVILPKKGKLSQADKQIEFCQEFIEARHKHAAVESAINALENHGLDRCLDHGIKGFKRYVALAVLARNIQILGAKIRQRSLDRQRRLERIAA